MLKKLGKWGEKITYALGSILLISGSVFAEPVEVLNLENDPMEQVTKVSEMRDVSSADWAFQALSDLVERYSCIAGYPDGTFRGNQAMSRYEFAAGVNACLAQMERLIASSQTVLSEDLATLQRLAQEFAAELTAIGTSIDNLENRAAFLEDNQFSTTTKLAGELITTLSQVFGNENAATGKDLDVQATLEYRLRLSLLTSFSGKDQLRLRLQSANYTFARGGTNYTDYNFSADTENSVILDKVEYSFPLGENTIIWLSAGNMNFDDVAEIMAPFANSFTEGAISYFGAISPIYLNSGGSGVAVSHYLTETLNLTGYYSADGATNPTEKNGLFNGQYIAAAQFSYLPKADTGIAIAYSHGYFPGTDDMAIMGFTGSALAENPFASNATSSDNIALLGTWRLSPFFGLEGWGMYTQANAESGDRQGDSADIWNWKISFAFPDLFQERNLGLISLGNPPKATSVEGGPEDEDIAWFVEALYVFQINDNISITPGVFVVTNPEDGRDPLWVGTIRTSFTF
ncbi:MAG: carbohydrate porin [Gomphosphaeria aponina SAG 52.96 = DSM 107014]|uniref:Carbohydrate porin n=1 Tax=Gomphosphaeria aponina SAG 52.96 = DSM 107014 TaxID=1521640 RepID=A0A941GM91_9CHRO|nr:carbohydrate porin [Gomphosphaeria aponina SAG 52.96 = DSM 107014]